MSFASSFKRPKWEEYDEIMAELHHELEVLEEEVEETLKTVEELKSESEHRA